MKTESQPPRTGSIRPERLGGRWRWILLLVVGAAAFQTAFWGRPVETHYRVSEISRPIGATAPREWKIEHRGSSAETWRARDTDGHGVMDVFETPSGTFARPGLRAEPRRWLVICLDGVPLGVMQSLWDRGHFREFFRPSPVVSVFPSDSEAALTAALHAAPVPGYEQRYFDRASREIRGGAWVTLSGSGIPYIRALDYDPPGWAKALPYLLPEKTYRADLGRLRKRFLGSSRSVFLAHISASDSLMHMYAAAKAEPFLVEFEDIVRELYLDSRGEMGLLIFSDHGNTQTPSHAAPLAPFLAARGWHLHSTLEQARDVVVPSYGLIGFIAVYCQEAAAERLARDLTQLDGVDLVVFRDASSSGLTILNAQGRARLAWSADGSRFSYDTAQGDPLELAPVFEKLRAEGRVAADGLAGDADLFSATLGTRFPDASARLRDWATNHVQNRANILVSLKPGYFHGAGIFQHIVNFSGTHGALDAASSLGFAMATRPLQPAVRLADLLPPEFLGRRNATTDLR